MVFNQTKTSVSSYVLLSIFFRTSVFYNNETYSILFSIFFKVVYYTACLNLIDYITPDIRISVVLSRPQHPPRQRTSLMRLRRLQAIYARLPGDWGAARRFHALRRWIERGRGGVWSCKLFLVVFHRLYERSKKMEDENFVHGAFLPFAL